MGSEQSELRSVCTVCHQDLPRGDYYYTRGRYQRSCKTCHKARLEKTWRKNRYGIDNDQYKAMLEAQGFCCAICKQTSEETLAIDHCHTSGHIRGLLCKHCNLALGYLKDNVESLLNAIAYLIRSANPSMEENGE